MNSRARIKYFTMTSTSSCDWVSSTVPTFASFSSSSSQDGFRAESPFVHETHSKRPNTAPLDKTLRFPVSIDPNCFETNSIDAETHFLHRIVSPLCPGEFVDLLLLLFTLE